MTAVGTGRQRERQSKLLFESQHKGKEENHWKGEEEKERNEQGRGPDDEDKGHHGEHEHGDGRHQADVEHVVELRPKL
jgi:hypothetical protein